jgi:hypothetical protein
MFISPVSPRVYNKTAFRGDQSKIDFSTNPNDAVVEEKIAEMPESRKNKIGKALKNLLTYVYTSEQLESIEKARKTYIANLKTDRLHPVKALNKTLNDLEVPDYEQKEIKDKLKCAATATGTTATGLAFGLLTGVDPVLSTLLGLTIGVNSQYIYPACREYEKEFEPPDPDGMREEFKARCRGRGPFG